MLSLKHMWTIMAIIILTLWKCPYYGPEIPLFWECCPYFRSWQVGNYDIRLTSAIILIMRPKGTTQFSVPSTARALLRSVDPIN